IYKKEYIRNGLSIYLVLSLSSLYFKNYTIFLLSLSYTPPIRLLYNSLLWLDPII
ncbi:hypothetical protein EJ05DRAFT_481182, partial [Pseudovirgaria hyperparasitica]